MPTNFDVRELEERLDEFSTSLENFDVERVQQQTLKEAASSLAEMVRLAVIEEDDIISPAMNGPHTRGPGPSLAQRSAWLVQKTGTGYTVRPDPRVEQRAIVLNFGYPGRITPNSAEALKFTIDGEDVFASSVEGPDRTGYWQAAVRRFEKSGEMERIAQQELREEAQERLR